VEAAAFGVDDDIQMPRRSVGPDLILDPLPVGLVDLSGNFDRCEMVSPANA
jgi:hypothetical protein